MKNLLILIVAAAIFLHFYPQPKLEAWFEEQKAFVLGEFSDATDTKVRLKSDKIYNDLKPNFNQFGPEELEFLKEITSNRKVVIAFHKEYCSTNAPKRTPKFHQANQTLVCKAIGKYQSLF
ncbi:hypothetical protein [Thalassotalea profundi]|uniref:Uncharacterized protein n=1 Tax=Thalassotalea profundi TaxID=2036687 RepID=A0ABQ3IP77_9GAMM|nr:hypothetical protein [Thalassotalea profundi]GHE88468.1 hypothetical protein GCM10011501_17350 [Thalassotalea profundi]